MLKEIATQLGTTTIVIGIAGFILKSWVSLRLEKLKSEGEHHLAIELETIKADWGKKIARLNVHENFLHKRRVKIIEDMYEAMLEAEFSLQNFLVSWWARTKQEDLPQIKTIPGLGDFEAENKKSLSTRGEEFCEKFLIINSTLHQHALYFEQAFIDRILNEYKPFYDVVMSVLKDINTPMPEEFEDILSLGKAPRSSVTNLFREALGVVDTSTGDSLKPTST